MSYVKALVIGSTMALMCALVSAQSHGCCGSCGPGGCAANATGLHLNSTMGRCGHSGGRAAGSCSFGSMRGADFFKKGGEMRFGGCMAPGMRLRREEQDNHKNTATADKEHKSKEQEKPEGRHSRSIFSGLF